jgi:putative NIF3 family GTP cyclohydrolase 1 type 2
LQQAIDEGADCLVTGEAAHHIAILAKQKGVGLVVAGHWGTEHPVVFALTDALTERLPKEVTVAPSLADVDPYSYL